MHGPLSRLQCCRDPAESATRPDLPTAKDSTSRTESGSFGEEAADYAESIRQSRQAGTPPREAQRLPRCLPRKPRLVVQRRAVLIHQMRQALPARSRKVALVRCCRRTPDNSFPRFRQRDHSTFRLPQRSNALRDPRCRKSARRKRPLRLSVARVAISLSIVPIRHVGTEQFCEPRRLRRSAHLLGKGSDDPASDRKASRRNILRQRQVRGAGQQKFSFTFD